MGVLRSTDWSTVETPNAAGLYEGFREDLGQPVAEVVDARYSSRIGDATGMTTEQRRHEWLFDAAVVAEECASKLAELLTVIQEGNTYLRSDWEWYRNEFGSEWYDNIAARVSEAFSGAEPVVEPEFDLIDQAVGFARRQVDHDQIGEAARLTTEAANDLDELERRWWRFVEESAASANRIKRRLEVTRDVSFLVATAIATGGAGSVLGVTSTLGRGAVAAGVAIGGRATQGAATGVGHIFAGTTEDFDVTDELVASVKSGAYGFAGGVIAAQASSLASRLEPGLTRALSPHLGDRAGEYARYVAYHVVDTQARAVAQTAAEMTVDVVAGRRFSSTGDFLDQLLDEFIGNQWENFVAVALRNAGATSTSGFADPDDISAAIVSAFR